MPEADTPPAFAWKECRPLSFDHIWTALATSLLPAARGKISFGGAKKEAVFLWLKNDEPGTNICFDTMEER
jgi:hypothetical protein